MGKKQEASNMTGAMIMAARAVFRRETFMLSDGITRFGRHCPVFFSPPD